MDDRKKLEHQIELATRVAACTADESIANRLRRFADQLRQRLFPSSQRNQITARAYELWEQAGRPAGKDLDDRENATVPGRDADVAGRVLAPIRQFH
jgi:hypothetical protein